MLHPTPIGARSLINSIWFPVPGFSVIPLGTWKCMIG